MLDFALKLHLNSLIISSHILLKKTKVMEGLFSGIFY